MVAAIRRALDEAEVAIRNHPQPTVALYEEGSAAFREGQDSVAAPEWLASTGLGLDDYKVLRSYLLAMAFIAAWYHLHGDRARRDQAAHSASLLVAGTGLPADSVFELFIQFEHLWRHQMSTRKIGRSKVGCMPALALLVAGGLIEPLLRR